MKLLQILNELQGISFDARVWNPIIRNAIKLSKNTPNPVIIGQNYPSQYQQFPIDFIHFKIDEDYFNGAGYNEQKSGYESDGKYHAYFIFGPFTDNSSINHELKHAFEDFKRISQGHNPMKSNKETITFFGLGFEKMMLSRSAREHFRPFTTLMEGLYYTSKIERSAFSDTVYDKPDTQILEYIDYLLKYANSDKILDRFSPEILEEKYKKMKKSYKVKILERFPNYQDFVRWACDEITYKGNKTIKKLRNVQYLSWQNKKEGDK